MLKRIVSLLICAVMLLSSGALAEGIGGVADTSDMTDVIDVVDESMVPVTADQLNDGVYPIEVDSSSSMFKPIGCDLTVSGGEMTATLYMKSEAYAYMYPGTAEAAAEAAEADLIALETLSDGRFALTLPIDALDAGYECAAFSARKQLWYPRTLVFRADSLPLSAWRADTLVTPSSLGLADGAYTCGVTLTGEGKATLASPAELTVPDGACTAHIVFSTKKIDYVIVDDVRYEPVSTDEGAAFDVPVAAFDIKLGIIVDSTAIMPSVEVKYSMTFDSSSIQGPADAEPALADGTYQPDSFTFSGGTGKVTISCPQVTVSGGQATATVVFSSPNYTRVVLNGVEYPAAHEEDNSVFEIPAPLNKAFTLTGTTTAMSKPHDVEYTLYIGLGAASDDTPDTLAGLRRTGSLPLRYARCFSVDEYEGGFSLITLDDGARYLVVPEGSVAPEGLDPDIVTLQQPLQNVYMASSAVMAFYDRLGALDQVRFSGTRQDGWTIEGAAQAMEKGDILFAGKYSEPDYELLVRENCGLAIESTMILHTPKVQELIELLNIPVFIDRSSYEPHPLGRTEWIKLYGVLTGHRAEAEAFFDAQAETVEALGDQPVSGKTVAYFYINTEGQAVIRGAGDYIARMIELGGGVYAFADMSAEDSARATLAISMEDFYAAAVDADYLIYATSIDTTVRTLADLRAKSPLFDEFKAVQSGDVWYTGSDLYQATDRAVGLITDVHAMLTGETDQMDFLVKLD